MKRQSRDRLRKDADTGIHRQGLHRRKLVDILPCSRLTKHERPTAEAAEVLRLVSRTEQPTEDTHEYHAPFYCEYQLMTHYV